MKKKFNILFWSTITVFYLIINLVFLPGSHLFGQQHTSRVFKLENPAFSIDKRISIALAECLKDHSIKRIWLGYEIRTSANTFYYKPLHNSVNTQFPQLIELIDNSATNISTRSNIIETADNYNSVERLAILFDYYLESGRPILMRLQKLSLKERPDISDHYLYWLGKSTIIESTALLISLFNRKNHADLNPQIISVLGTHLPDENIYRFLRYVLFNELPAAEKEACIFVLGRYGTKISDRLLTKFIDKSRSVSLKKKAILALGQSSGKAAFLSLVKTAFADEDESVRKQALFSIGQQPTQAALVLLKKVVYQSNNEELKKFAVFVLGQNPHPQASHILNKISQSHPDKFIRKKAHFWFLKTKNQRALHQSNIY